MLWIDEFQPKNFDDIVGNHDIVHQFKNMVKKDLLQNTIITGSVGLGKTSTIKVLCNSYLKNPKDHLLEINTSVDRNYSTLRPTLESFIKRKSDECKIVILEEIDNLPEATQHGIISLIQHKNVVFFFTCNSLDKIIENLQNKCLLLSFKKLSRKDVFRVLKKIVTEKQVEYDEHALYEIVDFANHDLRFAINHTQGIYMGYKKITVDTTCFVLEKSLYTLLQEYIKLCKDKQENEAMEYIYTVLTKGYSQADIFASLFKLLIKDNSKENLIFLELLGKYHVSALQSGKTNIQLLALTYELCQS